MLVKECSRSSNRVDKFISESEGKEGEENKNLSSLLSELQLKADAHPYLGWIFLLQIIWSWRSQGAKQVEYIDSRSGQFNKQK